MNIISGLITDASDLIGIPHSIPQGTTTLNLKDFLTQDLKETCTATRTWDQTTLETAKRQELAVIRSFVEVLRQKYAHKLTPQQKEILAGIYDSKQLFDSVTILELKNSFYTIRKELVTIVKTLFNLRMLDKLDDTFQKLNSGVLTYMARVAAVHLHVEKYLQEKLPLSDHNATCLLGEISYLNEFTDPEMAARTYTHLKNTILECYANKKIASAYAKLGRLKEAFSLLENSKREEYFNQLNEITIQAFDCLGTDAILEASKNLHNIEKDILMTLRSHYFNEVPTFRERDYHHMIQIADRFAPKEKERTYDTLFSIMTKPTILIHVIHLIDRLILKYNEPDKQNEKIEDLIKTLTKPNYINQTGMAEKAMTYIANEPWFWGVDYCLNQLLEYAIRTQNRHLGAFAISCFHPAGVAAFAKTINLFNLLEKTGLHKIA